jgi:hypothetical protein
MLPVRPRLAVIGHFGDGAWLASVLIASCAALAAGTYNPFIYFRF